ncbi:MAG: zinc ribbon domain-containing protein [Gemmatimonadaceae bacterium]
MPTYEYRCPEGHEFDHFFRSISAAQAEMPCPVCGKVGTRKVSGGAGLVFKGSGFYITDYGKDGKKDLKAPPPKSEGGDSGSSGSADKKSEAAKPASPTPPPSTSSE